MYETLDVERDGAIARVWLNRPDVLNAANTTMLEEIAACCDALNQEAEVGVVILGGRGRAFCAGADLKAPPGRAQADAAPNPRAARHAAQVGRRAIEAIDRLEATSIARVHGWAVGGGALLAMACDLRVAAESAMFWIPEVDLTVPLMWGGVPRLIACVGPTKARELILLCDKFSAADAERYGAINRVVSDGKLDATVDEWAHRLLEKDELARHVTKTQFRAYARRALLGDVTEYDADSLLMGGGRLRRRDP